MSHILKLKNHNDWLYIDKYCHMLEVRTNERDRFFCVCLFIVEIEPLKRAELLLYKLPVLKDTQQ